MVGNGLFDPASWGTATQPLGFDEAMAIYQRYRVHGVKVRATFTATTALAASSPPVVLALVPTNSAASITGLEQLNALPGAKVKTNVGAPASQSPTYLSIFRKTSSVLGVRPAAILDEDYSGDATGNPLNPWYIHFVSHSLNPAETHEGTWYVTVTFYVKFYDAKILNLS